MTRPRATLRTYALVLAGLAAVVAGAMSAMM